MNVTSSEPNLAGSGPKTVPPSPSRNPSTGVSALSEPSSARTRPILPQGCSFPLSFFHHLSSRETKRRMRIDRDSTGQSHGQAPLISIRLVTTHENHLSSFHLSFDVTMSLHHRFRYDTLFSPQSPSSSTCMFLFFILLIMIILALHLDALPGR